MNKTKLVIRLHRRGRKNYDFFDIVVSSNKNRRDGRYVEKVGYINPNLAERILVIDSMRIGY